MSLIIYALFDHPKDYPDDYVIRGFEITSGGVVPQQALTIQTEQQALAYDLMERMGKVSLGRQPLDDQKIIDVFI